MSMIRELLAEGIAALQATSQTARLDAELLLGGITGLSRAYMVGFGERPIKADDAEKFRALLKRRAKNEPIAYLTGLKEFFGLEFEVTDAVLIPRPETELLVELVLQTLSENHSTIADLGTGSGVIAVSVAMQLLDTNILATDISLSALNIFLKPNALWYWTKSLNATLPMPA